MKITIGKCLEIAKYYVVAAQAETLLSNLLEKDAFYLYLHLDEPVSSTLFSNFLKGIIYLSHSHSKALFIKKQTFCGHSFIITDNVLTPHIQTQEITYVTMGMIEELCQRKENLKALDMCCGSGVIGLSIKTNYPNVDMTLADKFQEVLSVANRNANELNVPVTIIESDLFEKIKDRYNIITINPPYLAQNHDGIMEHIETPYLDQFCGLEGHNFHVSGSLKNEPPSSLIGGETGLEFYDPITKQIDEHLTDTGSFFVLEFNDTQKDSVDYIIKTNLKEVVLRHYYSFKGETRAAFVFRGFTNKQIEQAIPKVLKRVPMYNIRTYPKYVAPSIIN